MEGTPYQTKEAVLKRAQELIGIPLGQIDKAKLASELRLKRTGAVISRTMSRSRIFRRLGLS